MIVEEEVRAQLWRNQQRELLQRRLDMLRALAAPPGPAARVRAAWRPVVLAIAEAQTPTETPNEMLEESDDRRNPWGCLIP